MSEELERLKQDLRASQLIAGYCLLKNGEIILTQEELQNGLAGYSIGIEKGDEGTVRVFLQELDDTVVL